jgi:hypothetical protein
VAVAGDRALVVSAPSFPNPVGLFGVDPAGGGTVQGGPFFDLEVYAAWQPDPPTVAGGRAWMSGGPHLIEVDVSSGVPLVARSYESSCRECFAGGPAIVDKTAWLARGDDGLEAVALDDPSGELVLDRTLATSGFAESVTAVNGALAVARVDALDVVDPVSGRTLASLPDVDAIRVQAAGEMAIVFERRPAWEEDRVVGMGSGGDWLLTLVDLSDAAMPVVLGSLTLETIAFADEVSAVLQGDVLYVADAESGLEIVKLSRTGNTPAGRVWLPHLSTESRN